MKIQTGAGVFLFVLILATPASAFDLNTALNKAREVAEAAKPMAPAQDQAAQEKLIGEQAAHELLAVAPLAPLPAMQRYVNQVGRFVAGKSERKDIEWRFAVLDDVSPNSWAAPDGYVFITTGLLHAIDSEAELAGILGHEIEHVVQRHHLKAIQKANERTALGNLATVATNTAGVQTPTVHPEIQKLRGSINDMYARGLDRGDEYDADRRGMELAARAGYDPYGLALVLLKLDASGKDSATLEAFTSTHPPIDARLKKLDKETEKLDSKYFPGRTQESRYHKFVQL